MRKLFTQVNRVAATRYLRRGSAVIASLLFVGAGSFALSKARFTHDSETWPAVPAMMVKNEPTTKGCPGRTLYTNAVIYFYAAGNHLHASNQLALYPQCGPLSKAQAYAKRYPLRSRVNAYVDPAHPRIAILEKQGLAARILAVLGGLSLLVACAVVYGLLRDLLRPRSGE